MGGLIKLGEYERALEMLVQAEEGGFYFGELLPEDLDALKDLPGYVELTEKWQRNTGDSWPSTSTVQGAFADRVIP